MNTSSLPRSLDILVGVRSLLGYLVELPKYTFGGTPPGVEGLEEMCPSSSAVCELIRCVSAGQKCKKYFIGQG